MSRWTKSIQKHLAPPDSACEEIHCQHGQGDGEAAWQPSLLALLQRLQIAEHGYDEFRDGWVNMHGTLNDRVGGISIHHVEHGMDDLIVAVDNM